MKGNNQNVLLIFVKKPEKGRVKTRLAEEIGEQRALEVYTRLLWITKRETRALNKVDKQVWYTPEIVHNDIWDSGDYNKFEQRGPDLGKRMENAFKDAFGNGYRKAVVIGSDCPYIKEDLIYRAYRKLDEVDIVIGPSEDGGYYLLGMSVLSTTLFRDKNWGSETVLQETLGDIHEQNCSVFTLPELNDVDTLSDLQAVAKDIYI